MSRTSLLALALVAAGSACAREEQRVVPVQEPTLATTPTEFTPAEMATFGVVPAAMTTAATPVSDAQVRLGRTLYYETLLSNGHDVSCNSCHPLNAWGSDGRARSLGDHGQPGGRNAPTVYNAAGHVAQFWDGRAPDVEAQAIGPILNPAEMSMPDSTAVLQHLRDSPAYRAAFAAAFPNEARPISYVNVGRAIGAFERGLVTPSRWDHFQQGDTAALTLPEREGLRAFMSAGCQTCHSGAYVGGGTFQKAGLVTPWPTQSDSGRMKITGNSADLFVFKVPSLRNVEKTAPYFHDGSVADLNTAVRLMARHQLGRNLSDADVAAIVTWLHTLTGPIPVEYVAQPPLPKGGP